jgi:hypothetical protein
LTGSAKGAKERDGRGIKRCVTKSGSLKNSKGSWVVIVGQKWGYNFAEGL